MNTCPPYLVQTMSKFNHRELCEIGSKFLKRPESANGHGCHLAIIEPASYGENADVIGFRHGTEKDHRTGTILLEAKTSRSDFLVDKKKPHRINPDQGVGKWRYYICPTDLIKPEDLDDGKWGLIYVNDRGHCKVIKGAMAVPFENYVCEWAKKTIKVRSQKLLEQSFIDHAFERRNLQNESNILTMALNRLGDAEELLYMQRNFNNMQNLVQNLKHQNMLLERRSRRNHGDEMKELEQFSEQQTAIERLIRTAQA